MNTQGYNEFGPNDAVFDEDWDDLDYFDERSHFEIEDDYYDEYGEPEEFDYDNEDY
jgi:hypothetical protein